MVEGKVVNLYINKESKYGCAIYENGIVEIFEFDEKKGGWQEVIGRADDSKDDMQYARTQKFFKPTVPEADDIIDVLFEHTNNTFIVTFVGAKNGLIQLRVGLVYQSNGDLDKF